MTQKDQSVLCNPKCFTVCWCKSGCNNPVNDVIDEIAKHFEEHDRVSHHTAETGNWSELVEMENERIVKWKDADTSCGFVV